MKQRIGWAARLPKILGRTVAAAVLLILAPIAFAVVMLESRPGGTGADPVAKIFVALLVLALAGAAGWAVKALAASLLRLRK